MAAPATAEVSRDPPDASRVELVFEALYRRDFDFVVTNLRRLGVAEDQLQDAAQDVFLIVHRRLPEFEWRAQLRTWLFSIVRNVAFRYQRAHVRRQRRVERLATAGVVLPDDPVREIEDRQASAILRTFLDSLQSDQREAFVLGEIERLGRREMGDALGVSPNTAYSRLRLARERFAATFDDAERRDALLQKWRAQGTRRDGPRPLWAIALARIGDFAVAAAPHASTTMVTTLALAGVLVLGWGAGKLRAPSPAPGDAAVAVAPPVGPDVRAPAEPPSTAAPATPEIELPSAAITASPVASPVRLGVTTSDTVSRRRRAARAEPPPALDAASSPGIAEELALLSRARQAVRTGEADVALRFLADHEKRFPAGAFALDRQVLRIDALCAAGDRKAAARASRDFLRAHGNSAEAAHVRSSCGVERP